MYGPKWPFSHRYGSRDTRHIDFSWVDGLSTDTPVLGRHIDIMEFWTHCKTREIPIYGKMAKS